MNKPHLAKGETKNAINAYNVIIFVNLFIFLINVSFLALRIAPAPVQMKKNQMPVVISEKKPFQ